MVRAAERLAELLRETGVKYVFGIPSGPWIPYMEALRREGIEFVLVSNEASAGFMGDVCARITGVPGVCYGTFGPGATNLTTGVGCAFLDRSPLIALTTEAPDRMRGRTMQMVIDQQALYSPLTKWTVRASADRFEESYLQAVHIALSERPGPVHVGLPADLGSAPVPESRRMLLPVSKIPPPEQSALEEARRLFVQARKPILAVGLTAARMRLCDGITQLAEKFGLPVLLTPMAKGLLCDSHPWYAGVLFHALSDRLAETHGEADLVIGVGYDSVEFHFEEWMPHVPLIHIDTQVSDIDRFSYPDIVDVVGDPAESLRWLLEIPAGRFHWDQDALAERKRRLFGAFTKSSNVFCPSAALQVLRDVLPEDGIVTCDVGAHTHLLGQMWPTPAPGRLIMTNGWSSMGFGMPAAIAAKLCLPRQAVACVVGDGGFLMMAGELATAWRLGINVVFVVLVDKALSLIRVKRAWSGLDSYGTDLGRGVFLIAERLFGATVSTARNREELRAALTGAFQAKGPVVVQALVNGMEYGELIARKYQ